LSVYKLVAWKKLEIRMLVVWVVRYLLHLFKLLHRNNDFGQELLTHELK
jgi:hypothetical protein